MIKNLLILLMLIPLNVIAYSQTQVSRYITYSNIPRKEQSELLLQQIHVKFPQSINTVGKAIDYLLNIGGYTLVSESKQSNELKIVLTKPLPIIDREIGSVSLKTALLTIVGSSFYLKDDPINRQVNFLLKNQNKRKHNKTKLRD